MARNAVWRAAPDDPRTPLGWFVADASARALSPTCVAFSIGALAILGYAWSPWVLLALPIIALNLRRPSRIIDLSALETSPSPGPAFACRIEVVMDTDSPGGALLGADEGIATFVEGWLHVAGRRADFALRRADLKSVADDDAGLGLGLPNGRALRLESLDDRDAERLLRAFRLWSNATATPEGESILPPDGAHPTGLARAWHGALTTVAVLLAGTGFLLAVHWNAAFVFVSGSTGFAAFHRLAEVRRLAREQRRRFGRSSTRPSR